MATSAERFNVFDSVIDNDLKIIQDSTTGFYNITKIKSSLPKKSSKIKASIQKWFNDDSTKEFIIGLKQVYSLDMIKYDLDKDIEKKYSGTYVHEDLFQHFLMWLSPRYAIKASRIIDNIQDKAIRKSLKEKELRIEELEKDNNHKASVIDEIRMKIAERSRMIDERNKKINQLLAFGNKLVGQNDKLQLTIDMNHEQLSESLDHLIESNE